MAQHVILSDREPTESCYTHDTRLCLLTVKNLGYAHSLGHHQLWNTSIWRLRPPGSTTHAYLTITHRMQVMTSGRHPARLSSQMAVQLSHLSHKKMQHVSSLRISTHNSLHIIIVWMVYSRDITSSPPSVNQGRQHCCFAADNRRPRQGARKGAPSSGAAARGGHVCVRGDCRPGAESLRWRGRYTGASRRV